MALIVPIGDPADSRIEAYRDIRERDLVGRAGLFVAEGEVVLRVLLSGRSRYAPQSLLIAEKRLPALAPLLATVPADVPVFAAAQPVMDAVAGFPIHRGILAVGRRGMLPPADEILAAAPKRAVALLLCGIANHDNIGGILRNAAAFGVAVVLLDADCCDPLYRKAIRVSVGAALVVPVARLARGEDGLALLEAHGFEPFALSPAGATELAGLDRPARAALVLGAEGRGLPAEMLARCRTVRIAMAPGMDSLNVATASGIALHHLAFGAVRG